MPKQWIVGALSVIVFTLSSSCAKDVTGPGPDPGPQPQTSRTYTVRVLSPSSNPLSGASVMLQTPAQNYTASTNGSGIATLNIPNSVSLPTWAVMVATHSSIMPEARSCPGAASASASPVFTTTTLPASMLVRDVYLHHLGNDQYGGSANSQLQLPTEGISRSYSFNLSGVPSVMPMIRFFARGVEWPAEFYINGHRVSTIGDSSPDGSVSLYHFRLGGNARSLLRAGSNTLMIKTGPYAPSDPWDDIEFCGVMLYQ